ncbi:MAG: pseudouridine synthase [Fidelibacterota bacterium]
MRLNRYLAASGIASRRKSVNLVRSGRVEVNGETVTNPFQEVSRDNRVTLDGEQVFPAVETVVVLLNKRKGVLTTVRDDRGRPTVLDPIKSEERLFPVGRLDRDTTGVLLLTNDGDLAYRLTHPKFEVEKIYNVTVDRPIPEKDLRKIERGVEIGQGEKGQAQVLGQEGGVSRDRGKSLACVQLRLTHGKKREIRRMVSALGYRVIHLHRESFAGFRAEGLAPGRWRQLTSSEVKELMERTSWQ